MAYTTGIATDYKNLLASMVSFAAVNGWTVLDQTSDRVYMRGEGDSGTDQIYVGIETSEDPADSIYTWSMYGSVAYRADMDYDRQVGSSAGVTGTNYQNFTTCTPFWNTSMPYWLFVTPSRIILVAKVSTTYQFVHLGFLEHTTTTPIQYPYPLLIGGTCNTTEYSYARIELTSFWSNQTPFRGALFIPGGSWAPVVGYIPNGWTSLGFAQPTHIAYAYKDIMHDAPDGTFAIFPLYYYDLRYKRIYGTINGMFSVTGYQQTAENILSIGGVNYMVFPDVYRTNYDDMCCIRMD